MAQLRSLLLRQYPIFQNHHRLFTCACVPLPFLSISETSFHRRLASTAVVPASRRSTVAAASRSHSLRQAESPPRTDLQSDVAEEEEEEESESESDELKKSRSQLKREARRAVRWGTDLASFSIPQIKRILSVASLEKDVFEAIILVKKLGPDVREGKRRQYNYIGKLLRSADPELMDALIRATKDGDHSALQSLAGSSTTVGDSDEDYEETDSDDEDEGPHIDLAMRWLEGLLGKDTEITNEVYSIRGVEFDRQELRKLVRRVHSTQENHKNATEENKGVADAAIAGATKSLTRYLCALAKQLANDM